MQIPRTRTVQSNSIQRLSPRFPNRKFGNNGLSSRLNLFAKDTMNELCQQQPLRLSVTVPLCNRFRKISLGQPCARKNVRICCFSRHHENIEVKQSVARKQAAVLLTGLAAATCQALTPFPSHAEVGLFTKSQQLEAELQSILAERGATLRQLEASSADQGYAANSTELDARTNSLQTKLEVQNVQIQRLSKELEVCKAQLQAQKSEVAAARKLAADAEKLLEQARQQTKGASVKSEGLSVATGAGLLTAAGVAGYAALNRRDYGSYQMDALASSIASAKHQVMGGLGPTSHRIQRDEVGSGSAHGKNTSREVDESLGGRETVRELERTLENTTAQLEAERQFSYTLRLEAQRLKLEWDQAMDASDRLEREKQELVQQLQLFQEGAAVSDGKELEQQLAEVSAKLEAEQRAAQQLREQSELVKAELESARASSHQSAGGAMHQDQDKIHELEQAAAKLKEKNFTLIELARVERARNEELEESASELARQLEAARHELYVQRESFLETLAGRDTQMYDALEEAAEKLAQAEARFEEATDEAERERERIAELEKELYSSPIIDEEANQMVLSLQQEVQILMSKVSEADAALRQEREASQAARSEAVQMHAALEEMRASNESVHGLRQEMDQLLAKIAKADQEASWERQASAAAREETASLRASLAEVQGELQEALQREEELAQWIDEIEASGWEHEQAWDAQSENAPQEDYSYGQQVQEEVLVKAPGSDRERILRQHLERALNEVQSDLEEERQATQRLRSEAQRVKMELLRAQEASAALSQKYAFLNDQVKVERERTRDLELSAASLHKRVEESEQEARRHKSAFEKAVAMREEMQRVKQGQLDEAMGLVAEANTKYERSQEELQKEKKRITHLEDELRFTREDLAGLGGQVKQLKELIVRSANTTSGKASSLPTHHANGHTNGFAVEMANGHANGHHSIGPNGHDMQEHAMAGRH